MAYRQILPITDPLLTQPSAPIGEITDEIRDLARDMLETSRAVNGAGIAAVQVGVPVRLVIVDLIQIGGDTLVMVNPEIIGGTPEVQKRREGCLSMPGVILEVERAAGVRVDYTDLTGERRTYEATDFAAVAVQHELDHLDGVRHIDHLSPLRRAMALKQFQKHRTRQR